MADVVADLTVGPPPAPETATPNGAPPAAGAKPKRERKPRAPRARTQPQRDQAGVFPSAPPPMAQLAPEITEGQVRSMLRSGSGMLGAFIGDEDVPRHWHFTSDELDELVPPLTRYINRTPRLLLAAEHGDELTIMLALAQWGGRNVMDAKTAKEARREREPEAESAAPPGGGLLGLDRQGNGDGRQGDRGGAVPAAGGPDRPAARAPQ